MLVPGLWRCVPDHIFTTELMEAFQWIRKAFWLLSKDTRRQTMRKKTLGIMVLLLVAGLLLSGCATPEAEYEKARVQIQDAVTEYMVWHDGLEPPHGEIINTTECDCIVIIPPYPQGGWIYGGYVLDLCYLLHYCTECETLDYFPFELPLCCYGQSGEEGTNFYTGNCSNPYKGHYVWLIDEVGTVCSVCVGDECWANNESGYQGVWP